MREKENSFIDNEEINEYIKEYQKTNNEAVKKRLSQLIVLTYSPLIKNIVHTFARRLDDPYDDLFQVGAIGLIKAIGLFNPQHGKSFKTYATFLVTGEIRHYLRDKASMIKAPRPIRELSYRLHKITTELTNELGEEPDDEAIAKRLQLDNQKMQEVMNLERRTTPISIEQIIDNDDDSNKKDLGDMRALEEYKGILSDFENHIMLKDALSDLEPELKEIIEMSFFEDMTQAQIAQKMKTNPMNISRKTKKALGELFKIITKKGYNKYDE